MKKTYIAPSMVIVALKHKQSLMAGSLRTSGLEGHGGYGGESIGKSADGRQSSFWDDEE
jgi:hypothetical protein